MKYFATVLLLCLTANVSLSQITITSAQFKAAFEASNGLQTADSYTSTDFSGVAALVATSGANQAWDFNARTYTKTSTSGTFTLIPLSSAPLLTDPDLKDATHVIKMVNGDTTAYQYVKINDNGYYFLGLVGEIPGFGTIKIQGFNPPMQRMAFPLTYQTTWNSTSQINGITGPSGSVTISGTVDSYGTLLVPAGSAPVLRVKVQQQTVVSSVTTTTIDYQFNSSQNLNGHISTAQDGTPKSIGYSMVTSNAVKGESLKDEAITLSANPISTSATISLNIQNSGTTTISLIDMLGRQDVLFNSSVNAGPMSYSLNVPTLPNGTYFIRVESPGMTAMKKLVVSH